MIGFFDSGLGGLTVMKEVVKFLPEYSYVYLGDNARAPYGARSERLIYEFTAQGVRMLFNQGAELVVLACNSASAAALRRIQQEFLPARFPGKRVLGIIIPTAEEAPKATRTGEIGILATEATVRSRAYSDEILKIDKSIKVHQEPAPLLVPIIEAGEVGWEGLDMAAKKYLDRLFIQSDKIDTIILGCTHYAIIEDRIRRLLPQGMELISQGEIVALKLKDYLARHPVIEKNVEKGGERVFFSTEDSGRVRELSSLFYSEPIEIRHITLH